MSPVTEGIFIGAASLVIASFITYCVVILARMWHTPKRVDRLDAALPLLMEVMSAVLANQLAVIRCVTSKTCNGELEEAMKTVQAMKEKMWSFLGRAVVSHKETR